MRKKLLLLAAVLLSGLSGWADTEDVTSTYLTNADFSSDDAIAVHLCGYKADISKSANLYNGSNALYWAQDVTGWTVASSKVDNNAAGIFAYGSDQQLKGNGKAAPATNPSGEASGKALGMFAVWSGDIQYTQTVTFPKGIYTITFTYYNQSGTNAITNKFGFVEDGGTTHYGSTTSFATGSWKTEVVTLELSAETSGKISVGYTSKGSGSGANPMLFIDNVKIEKATSIDVSALTAEISKVQTIVDNSTGTKTTINAAIGTAQAVADAPESLSQVSEAVTTLETALQTYEKSGAMPNDGYTFDMTFTITNPSFELGNYSGWTTTTSNDTGAKLNSNATYTMTPCDGEYLFNTWSVGTAITQTVSNLPAGYYTLSCYMATDADKTFSLKGNTTEGTASSVDKSTGVQVSVNVAVTDGTLAISAGTSDKYWYKVDNFTLSLVRALTADDFPSYTLVEGDMNAEVKTAQTDAETEFKSKKDLTSYNALTEAIKNAQASADAYAEMKAYYEMTRAKVSGDYTTYTTAYEAGTYTTAAEGIAAIKATRNTAVTTSMTANQDLTALIDNAGFELGNTNYWTSGTNASSDFGAKSTSDNTYKMSGSEGNYLYNTWWQGAPLYQSVGTLPAGVYQLSATVASDGGTIYYLINGQPNSYVEATDKTVGITGTSTFTLTEAQEVTIGVVGGASGTAGAHKDYSENGYWFYKVDNFQLKYLGATAPENTLDGTYTLATGDNYIGRGGDSSTEAVAATSDNALAATITTDAAGIQTIVFYDNNGYMMWNGEMVYTDGTMQPKKTTHLPYWKFTAVEGGYQILNTESGKYLTTGTATRNDAEIIVVTLSETPATWVLGDATAAKAKAEMAAAKANLATAIAAAPEVPTVNVGSDIFQYSKTDCDNITSTVKAAQEVYDNASATLDEVNAQITAVQALTDPSVIQPSAAVTGSIKLVYSGWTYDQKVASAYVNSSTQGGYSLGYWDENTTDHYDDWTITPTTDGYVTFSFTDADNATRYMCTGVVYGGNAYQIRTTTDEASALKIKVVPSTTTEGIISFLNTEANMYIGSQDQGVYTVNSHNDFQFGHFRTTASGKHGTICLPYNFKATGADLYTINKIDGNSIEIVEVTTDDKSGTAGVPYIYCSTAEDGKQAFTYKDATAASAPVAGANGLIGSFTKVAVPAGSYVMQTQDDVQGFYKVATDNTVYCGANKCYLTVGSGSGVKAFYFGGDETAISALNALTSGNAAIYDLNGRQLSRLQKGINIVNGKKIIVK